LVNQWPIAGHLPPLLHLGWLPAWLGQTASPERHPVLQHLATPFPLCDAVFNVGCLFSGHFVSGLFSFTVQKRTE
jgi:hypothetical protein